MCSVLVNSKGMKHHAGRHGTAQGDEQRVARHCVEHLQGSTGRAASLLEPADVVSSVSLQMTVVADVLVVSLGNAAMETTVRARRNRGA